MKALASFPTSFASRYLSMLCTHFGNRVKVDCNSHEGSVQFPFGRCEMAARDSHLEICAMAEDQTQLEQVVQIITSHLERFAFRENPTLDWHDPEDCTPHPS